LTSNAWAFTQFFQVRVFKFQVPSVAFAAKPGDNPRIMVNDFYVYEHWRHDTGACFYVGKGRGRRARSNKRNPHHANVVAKLRAAGLEYEVKIVASELVEENAFALEKTRIELWRTLGVRLTNLTDGGDGPTNPTEEVRQKIRAARARQVFTDEHRRIFLAAMQRPETRARMSTAAKARPNNFAGHRHSDETKAEWSRKRKGKKLTDEHRAKISAGLLINNGFRGKHHTPETKAKISASNKTRDLSFFNFAGRKHTPETKAKMSAAHMGRTKSPETRAKMSAARRARDAKPSAT
jgi:hypothetical protein